MARPPALQDPVNSLEAERDTELVWRRHVNAALTGPYQALFARIDRLVLLAAPGFEVVHGWRLQQERALAATCPAGDQVMKDAEIARFIAHYERLTRHILADMRGYADLVIRLNRQRRPVWPAPGI